MTGVLPVLGPPVLLGPPRNVADRIVRSRSRLGVLTFIALGSDGAVWRDELIGTFWPETHEESARGRLRQILYGLRRDLPGVLLRIGRDALQLNPNVLSTDTARFLTAVEAGDYGTAVAIHRGPLLEGIRSLASPQADLWLAEARARFRALADQVRQTERMTRTEVPIRREQEVVWRVIERWINACAVADWDQLMALLADDAVILPPHEPAVRGRVRIHRWFAARPPVLEIQGEPLRIEISGNTAWMTNRLYIRAEMAPGIASAIQFNAQSILRRQHGGEWLVVSVAWAPTSPGPVF